MSKNSTQENIKKRSPVVSVMGHVDHGKSSLLDYIRKTNIVEKEAGGITQHLSAYEVEHKGEKITFLDIPGHEAFSAVKKRGASVADLVILIVSATEGVKDQTVSAIEFIKESKTPFLVAFTKIDLPNKDVEKAKLSLLEKEVYLEGMGGDVSYTEISSKTGEGIENLLELVSLKAEVENFTANFEKKATGFVLEAHKNPKVGISATLLIKEGTLNVGDYIVSGKTFVSVKRIENSLNESIKEASASSPVLISGFQELPLSGSEFYTFSSKKEAEKFIEEMEEAGLVEEAEDFSLKNSKNFFPLIVKADVSGSLEAIKSELKKITDERSEFKIIEEGTGNISESDLKKAGAKSSVTVVGFGVKEESSAKNLAEIFDIEIKTFNIIYELSEYLQKRLKELTPKERIEKEVAKAKVLKIFSWDKKGGVVGGEVLSGEIFSDSFFKIERRGQFLETGKILQLQSGKKKASSVKEGVQFGVEILTKNELMEGDILVAFKIEEI